MDEIPLQLVIKLVLITSQHQHGPWKSKDLKGWKSSERMINVRSLQYQWLEISPYPAGVSRYNQQMFTFIQVSTKLGYHV